ncbi:MAG: 4Fe-4S cluster-binding domain-containing protein [Atribacterota bacterium]
MIEIPLITFSVKDGLGQPSINIHFQGCDKEPKCKKCHSPELHSPPEDEYDLDKIFDKLKEMIQFYQGFTNNLSVCYMGGEPLAEYNRQTTYEISSFIRGKFKINNILYSWRTVKQIKNNQLLEYVDFMDFGVLGEFDINKKQSATIPPSSNQCIYDFNKNQKIKPISLKQ